MNTLTLNGQPVGGRAVLETLRPGGQRIWASITVAADSPVYQAAREAVLANDLEVTLAGEAHEPLEDVPFGFRAKGQLVNGRVGQGVKADFRLDVFLTLEFLAEDIPAYRPRIFYASNGHALQDVRCLPRR